MKKLILIQLVLTGFYVSLKAQSSPGLYPIYENSLYGFINETGKVVIKPQYHSIGNFSEGLAPARKDGLYGYIDETGNYTLAPKYDYAEPFDHGMAKVYVKGKLFFIDRYGTQLFIHNFKEINGFGAHSFAIAVSESGKMALIDRKGHLITDTIFNRISAFEENRAVVNLINEEQKNKHDDQCGMIDSLGHWIVKPGIYFSIVTLKEGFYEASIHNNTEMDDPFEYVVINKNGKLKFSIPKHGWHISYGSVGFSEGKAIIEFEKTKSDSAIKDDLYMSKYYYGILDTNGNVLSVNKNWMKLGPFKQGKAFAKMDDKWYMLGAAGKVRMKMPYNAIYNKSGGEIGSFESGVAFVEDSIGVCAIDTSGKIIARPIDKINGYEAYYAVDSILILRKDVSVENRYHPYPYGYWNIATKALLPAIYENIGSLSNGQKLILVEKDGKDEYIDTKQCVLWKENIDTSNRQYLNIDFMNRGYYHATNAHKPELDGYGGYGGSDNNAQPLHKGIKYKKHMLQLYIDNRQEISLWKVYTGYKMFLVNALKDTVYFSAEDSRLPLIVQAKDEDGNWRDIEYLPHSWCGNSYHTLYLDPNQYWQFTMPAYEGGYKTVLRAKITCKPSANSKDEIELYSNEIKCSINPGQFWRKREYFPTGLMDSYNE